MEKAFWKGRGFIGVFAVYFSLPSFFLIFLFVSFFLFLFLFLLVSSPSLGFDRAAVFAKIVARLLDC